MSLNETKPILDENNEEHSFEMLEESNSDVISSSDVITDEEFITSDNELDSLLDDLISGDNDPIPTQSENSVETDKVISEDIFSTEQDKPKKEYTTQTVLTTKKKPTVLDMLNAPIQLPFSAKNNDKINTVADQISDEERLENERLEAERVAAEKLEQERLELERIINEHMEEGRAEAERLEKELLEQEKNKL